MIHVCINGVAEDIPIDWNMRQLLHAKGLSNKKVAIELNEEILPARQFDEVLINAGDKIEIVHAIGGG